MNNYKYDQAAERYEKLREIHATSRDDEGSEQNQESKSKLEEMKTINQDYVGWITIPDTNIDYPVVQTEDNEFYLDHNFYKEEDRVGSIFMDYRNTSFHHDSNIIIYGHNMKDKTMFTYLNNYLDEIYFRSHQKINLSLFEQDFQLEVFSVYKTTETDWMQIEFQGDEFQSFLEQRKAKSLVSTEIDVSSEDTILTLSTCTSRSQEERIIVHAKLNEGE